MQIPPDVPLDEPDLYDTEGAAAIGVGLDRERTTMLPIENFEGE
jgi:hypothetical protein